MKIWIKKFVQNDLVKNIMENMYENTLCHILQVLVSFPVFLPCQVHKLTICILFELLYFHHMVFVQFWIILKSNFRNSCHALKLRSYLFANALRHTRRHDSLARFGRKVEKAYKNAKYGMRCLCVKYLAWPREGAGSIWKTNFVNITFHNNNVRRKEYGVL